MSASMAIADSNLHLHADWLRLNAYERYGNIWHSHIRNADYFFHPKGQFNPQAELAAFSNAIKLARNDTATKKRICQYPARLAFFKKNNHEVAANSEICKATEIGKMIAATKSVSLIFADGYFGNPASYYGHVLLKLNTTKNPGDDDIGLLDTAINYGAKIPPNENALIYIAKGVFGFYKGSFQSNDFFLNTAQYADQQSRDFWAYDLTLSEEQAKHIARRAMEWKNAKFDYYFFGDNCAHRVRDLLTEVTGKSIALDNGLWLMPMQVLVGVGNQKARNEPALIANIRYLPSGRSRLFAVLENLSAAEMHALLAFLDGQEALLNDLSASQQKTVLAAADLHLRKIIADAEAKNKAAELLTRLKEKRQNTLLLLLRLQATKAPLARPTAPHAPHSGGRNGTAVTLSAIDSKRSGRGQYLTIRPAYTDKLATDVGKIADSTLHMGKMEFSHFGDTARLEKLTVVEVENLRAANFDRRFEPGRVWYLSGGLHRVEYEHDNPLIGFFEAAIGRNHLLADNVNSYIMAQAHITEETESFRAAYPSLRYGVVARLGEGSKLLMEQTVKKKKNGDQFDESLMVLRSRISANADLEWKFKKSSEDEEQTFIGLQLHF